MYQRRTDTKGRVLQKGESERKDGLYQFRYTDKSGVRHTFYERTLNELRIKEQEVMRDELLGCDYSGGKMKMYDLVDAYIHNKRNISLSTLNQYQSILNKISRFKIAKTEIRNISMNDAKQFVIQLYDSGMNKGGIETLCCVVRPSFKQAYVEGIIKRNPFDFKISDIIPDGRVKRTALTPIEQDLFLTHVKTTPELKKYYNAIFILLNTGLRRGEFCGLTLKDVDFHNSTISVNHQLISIDSNLMIAPPKSESGNRIIPVSREVIDCIQNEIKTGVSTSIIDGYSGFIFKLKDFSVYSPHHLNYILDKCVCSYNQSHAQIYITPHILRHTYCSNMARTAISPKTLQYIMGHSSIGITMDVYTHVDTDSIVDEIHQIYTKQPQKYAVLQRDIKNVKTAG